MYVYLDELLAHHVTHGEFTLEKHLIMCDSNKIKITIDFHGKKPFHQFKIPNHESLSKPFF